MDITLPNLLSINDVVSLAYNTQFWETPTIYDKFTFEAPSSGRISIYPRLNMLPGLRQWLGDRVVNQLSTQTFSIENLDWEQTVGISRNDIEDDQFGLLTTVAKDMAMAAKHLPDLQIASLMAAGNSTLGMDGVNFFATNHANPTSSGGAGTVANYQSGGGPAWYLLDTSKILRPWIWQKRKPFTIIPKFSPTDDNVLWTKELEWGVDGRAAAGYGLWQLAYMGLSALTMANIITARTSMASIRRPDGTPMGILPNLLVVPTALYADGRAFAENQFVPIDAITGASTLGPNILRGLFGCVENPWLNA